MAHHPVVGDSPFLKRVLIPFWVVRILFMVIEIGIYGLAIGVLSATKNDIAKLAKDYGLKVNINTAIAILCVIEAIILLCLILDIVSIVKRAQRKLTPRFFLIVNVIQTTFWVVMFIMSMIGANTGLSIGLNVGILLSFIGLLIYAAIIFHRHRKGTLGYSRTTNPVETHNLVTATGYPSAYPPAAYPPPAAAPYGVDPSKPSYYDVPVHNVPPIPPQTEAQFQHRY